MGIRCGRVSPRSWGLGASVWVVVRSLVACRTREGGRHGLGLQDQRETPVFCQSPPQKKRLAVGVGGFASCSFCAGNAPSAPTAPQSSTVLEAHHRVRWLQSKACPPVATRVSASSPPAGIPTPDFAKALLRLCFATHRCFAAVQHYKHRYDLTNSTGRVWDRYL